MHNVKRLEGFGDDANLVRSATRAAWSNRRGVTDAPSRALAVTVARLNGEQWC